MTQAVFGNFCGEGDIGPLPYRPRPRLAGDGSCAHPDVDPADRCRLCFIPMDAAAYEHRERAWLDSQASA